MLKNQFGQITKQPLSNFETWKFRKYKQIQIWVLGPDRSC